MWWVLPSSAVLASDQFTKWLALSYLDPGWPVAVVPGLNWYLTFNRGIAFSAFAGSGDWQRWVFSGVAAAIALVVAVVLWRHHRKPDLTGWGLALILGGALGNLIDRLRFGVVVDFIDCYLGSWHWPAFNVADSAISVGAVLLVITMLRPDRNQKA